MKCLLLSVLTLLLQITAHAQNDIKQIETLLNAQKDAWNNGNMEGYMDGYWQSDSLIFIGSSGITKGWRNTLERYKKAYPDKKKMGQLSFVFEKIDVLSQTEAFVLGRWALKRENGDLAGFFTLRLRKISGYWKVILDHSS